MTGPALRDLELFTAVAATRNFRRAAVAQGLPVSSLSQRIQDLEARLGVRLFHRTTRSVALTEAGERLHAQVSPALAEVAAALRAVSATGAPSGRLRINAPAPAAHLVLAPMIPAFLARHPQIQMEVTVEASLIDIVAEGFDAGIRYDETLAQGMIAVPLGGPQRYVVVASPDRLRGLIISEPEDLVGQPCLATRFPSGLAPAWEFEKGGRIVRIAPTGPLVAADPRLLVGAAIDGLGFYATFEGYVREAVQAGRLVTVLDDWCQEFPGPFLYYPGRRQPPPALRAFLDFLAEWRRRPMPPA
jgi:DNA-binding transcriptional LysR family regulator